MAVTKTKFTALRTVYPPISNADAVRLMRIPGVESLLRTSGVYMIGGRAQAQMINPQLNLDKNIIEFVVGDHEASPVRVALQKLPGRHRSSRQGFSDRVR